jgi:non-canonical (house-cleaning) NTP pyrophosphatase
MEKEMYIFSWVAVVSKNGRRSFGSTGWLPLPEIIAREIRKGGELGPVMDKIYQDSDIKKKGGAVGMYTNNLITRTNFFETAVILAMSKFIHESYY